MLSIVIPVYNERDTLPILLQKIEASDVDLEKEIIIVDDFSTDGSREFLQELEKMRRRLIIYHTENRGKGAALRTGFQVAKGDYIITQDADLEYSPSDYKTIIEPLILNETDVVYGSRFGQKKAGGSVMPSHLFGNLFLTKTSNLFTGLNLTDMETGYKAFSRQALDAILPELQSDRFGIEPELTARVVKKNLRIIEVPISYFARGKADGKKIRWRDGFPALWAIIRFNLFN